jgi:hypothetical protein
VQEQEAHRASQELVVALFRLFSGLDSQCPELSPDLRCFGAYFLPPGPPHEGFEKEFREVEQFFKDFRDVAGESFTCSVLFESLQGESVLLGYLADAFKTQTIFPGLAQVVLSALSRAKPLSAHSQEALIDLLLSFKQWSRSVHNRAVVAELAASFASIRTPPGCPARAIQLDLVAGSLTEQDSHELMSDCLTAQDPSLFSLQTQDELIGSIPILLSTGDEEEVKCTSLQIKGFGCNEYTESEQDTEETCTYRQTGREYQMQHWYYCYTCDLVGSKGCCSVCVRRCHAGHQVAYSRKANFFCDCGHSSHCKSMPVRRPWDDQLRRRISDRMRDEEGRSDLPELIMMDLDRDYGALHYMQRNEDIADFEEVQASPYFIEEEKELIMEEDKEFYIEEDKDDFMIEDNRSSSSESSSAPSQTQQRHSPLAQPLAVGLRGLKPVLSRLCRRRLPQQLQDQLDTSLWTVHKLKGVEGQLIGSLPYQDKRMESSRALTKAVSSFKSFSSVYKSSQMEEQTMKDSCLNYPVLKQKIAAVPSLDMLLMAESTKLLAVDATLLKVTGFDLDRNQMVVLARHSLPFDITSVTVNPHNHKLVAVSGLSQCVVFQLHDQKYRGYAKAKLTLDLQQEQTKVKNPILKTAWLSVTQLAVATPREVKIYELSDSIYRPKLVFMGQETDLTDLAVTPHSLLASSCKGFIYRQALLPDTEGGVLREVIRVSGKEQGIMALSYLAEPDLLITTFSDTQVLIGRLNAAEDAVQELQWLNFSQEFSSYSINSLGFLCNFSCLDSNDGLVLLATARKTNSSVVVLHITREVCYVHVQKKGGYTEGLASYEVDSDVYVVSCHEGSSVSVSCLCTEGQATVPVLSTEVLNSWLSPESLPKSVQLPVTFFEKCTPLNAQRLLGGMSINRNELVLTGDPVSVFGSSKVALEKLSVERSSEGNGISTNLLADPKTLALSVHLEGSSSSSIVLAGFKVLVDAPSGTVVEMLNRKIKLQPGKRWYDLSLCDIEVIKAHLQGRLALRLILPNTRVTLRLINLEVFGLSAAAFSLDQKLSELSRATQGHTSPEEQALLFSQHSAWSLRKQLLFKLDPSHRSLFLTAAALSSFSEDGSDELVLMLTQSFFNCPSPLARAAAKESVRGLLSAAGKSHAYQPLKALAMAWHVTYAPSVSSSYIQRTVKSLAKLQKQQVYLLYICSSLPALCTTIASQLKAKAFLSVAEDCMKLLLADLHRQTSLGSPNLTPILTFLQHEDPIVRREALQQLYPLIKRRTKAWIASVIKSELPTTLVRGLSLTEILSEVEPPNLSSCLEPLLRNVETEVQLKDCDICYSLLEGVLGNLSLNLSVADSTLGLFERLLKMLEKLWLAEDWYDIRYFELFATTLIRVLEGVSPAEGFRCALLRIIHKILAGQDSIDRHLIGGLMKKIPKDILDVVFGRLRELLSLFRDGQGSKRSVYLEGVFLEVVPSRDTVSLVSQHCGNEVLMRLMGDDPSFYAEDYDQFLVRTLLLLATELLRAWKNSPSPMERTLQDVVAGSSSDEEESGYEESLDESFEVPVEYVQLLCECLKEPSLRGERPYINDLLRLLTSTEDAYFSLFHRSIYDSKLRAVELLAQKTENFTQIHNYHDQVAISSSLKAICKRAAEHPEFWQQVICPSNCQINQVPVVLTLFRGALNLEGEQSTACVGLLALAFGVRPKQGLGFGLKVDREAALDQSPKPWGGFFKEFQTHIMEVLLLESHNKARRSAAGALLIGMWRNASESQRDCLLMQLLSKLGSLHRYGSNSDVFLSTLNEVLEDDEDLSSESRQEFIARLFGALQTLSQQLSVHPNCDIYEALHYTLSTDPRVGFSGYFLENEPCMRCYEAQNTVSEPFRLQEVQAEAKFAESGHFVQLKDPLVISEVKVDISDHRGNRAVDRVTFYVSNREFQDLSALKTDRSAWNKVSQVDVAYEKPTTVQIVCKEPVLARYFMLEYHTVSVLRTTSDDSQSRSFYGRARYTFLSSAKPESRGEIIGVAAGPERELLPCPRCSKVVEDRHGRCSCGENAFQCVQCRNINYEHLNAFFCNECGTSRYCKLEVGLTARIGSAKDRVVDEETRQLAEQKVDRLLESIQGHFDLLPKLRESLQHLVFSAKGLAVYEEKEEATQTKSLNPVLLQLANVYTKEARHGYTEMMKAVRSVVSLRKELILYSQGIIAPVASDVPMAPVVCFGCLHGFLSHLLSFFKNVKDPQLKDYIITQNQVVSTLFSHTLHSPCAQIRRITREALCSLVRESYAGSCSLYELMEAHIDTLLQLPCLPLDVLREDLQVFFSLCSFNVNSAFIDTPDKERLWNLTLQHFWKVFLKVLTRAWTHSGLAHLLDKFLELVLDIVYKVVVFQEGDLYVDNPEEQELIIFNSALRCNVLHSSTGHQDFLNAVLNSTLSGLYAKWQTGAISFLDWKLPADSTELKLPHNWLVDCLLFMQYPRIQDLARMILLCLAESGLNNAVLEVVVAALPKALRVCQQGSDYYFTVLSYLLLDKKCSQDVTLLHRLLNTVETASNTLLQSQERCAVLGLVEVSISQGHGLSCLLLLISSLGEQEWARKELRRGLSQVIRSLLNVRRLTLMKNKVIAESQEYLERLFETLHTDCSSEERNEFITQCVAATKASDQAARVFLYEQICKIIAPKRPDPVYFLHLSKSASQEEYIRGSMEKNPYSSKEVGPLMKHVRERICRELELSDPELLELLVAERIISPELKVIDVYEHVLWPFLQETSPKFEGKAIHDIALEELPNMIVVYRLAGLDGEATEDRVDSLPCLEVEVEDLETKYAVAGVLGQPIEGTTALEQALCALEESQNPEVLTAVASKGQGLGVRSAWGERGELQRVISSLLHYGCMLHHNRQLFMMFDGLDRVLRLLQRDLESSTTTRLLQILEQVLSDSSLGKIQLSPEHMRVLLDKLDRHLEHHPEVVGLLTQILPEVLDSNQSAFDEVYATFNPCISWERPQHGKTSLYAECWVKMLSNLDVKHVFIRNQLMRVNHTQTLLKYIGGIALTDQVHVEQVCAALSTLTGLCRGHAGTQRLLSTSLLKAVYELSHTHATLSHVGDLCEILIETLVSAQDGAREVKDFLEDLIELDQRDRRAKADSKRREVLGQMTSAEDLAAMFGLEEGLEEEEGLSCVICKEGYTLRPHEVLGFYVYSKPTAVSLAVESTQNPADTVNVVSCVTHFTVIHSSCHENAARAERGMRKPKSEWEGATIRNQHTKCNNWFPIRGPHTSDSVYSREVTRMFSRSEPEVCQLQNAVHDLRLMLTRFGYEMSFSKDSKGGGPEHNLQAVPYLLQMALHLYKTADSDYAARVLGSLQDFMSAEQLTEDQILYCTTVVFMLQPTEAWQGYKLDLLKRAVMAARLKTEGQKSVFIGLMQPGDSEEQALLTANSLRPLLIVFKIVESFFTQCFFTVNSKDWPTSLLEYLTHNSPNFHDQVRHIYEEVRVFSSFKVLRLALEALNCVHDLPEDLAEWLLR